MVSKWALKAKGKDIYVAAQQYGPPGAFTVSTKEGRPPIYSPKIFTDKEMAEQILKKIQGSSSGINGPFKDDWEIVEFEEAGKTA